MKLLAKTLAYRSGLLGAWHALRNRDTLTVAMFHRVLPAQDPRHPGSDPEWTMSPHVFERCLGFFKRHYTVVTPEQVFSALRGEERLPPRSMLVTFDDGWADTYEYAHPLLRQHGVSALVFVAGKAIGSTEPFLEEHVYSWLATEPDGMGKLRSLLSSSGVAVPPLAGQSTGDNDIRRVIALLASAGAAVRDQVAAAIGGTATRAMMDADQIGQLAACGHAIGGHGHVHAPLTRVPDLAAELDTAQATLARCLGASRIESMSFPHGAHSDAVVDQCQSAGYRFLFSSVAELTVLPPAPVTGTPIGRIHISEAAITCPRGVFRPALLAQWLFARPLRRLAGKPGGGHG